MRELKQSATANVMVFMSDSTDHITGKTGLTLTVTLSKDGAAFASITPTVTERGTGWYNVALGTGDIDTTGDLIVRATATGADPGERTLNVVANVEADTYGIASNGTYGNAALNTKLGAPAASVSADIAAVKTDTGNNYSIVNNGTYGNSALNTAIGTRLATSGYTAPDNTTIGTINTKLGTPAGASVSVDIAAVKSDTGIILPRIPSEVAQKSHFVNGTGNITPPVNIGIWDRVDAAISSRSIYAGGAVASVTAGVTVAANSDKTGYSIAGTKTTLDALNDFSPVSVATESYAADNVAPTYAQLWFEVLSLLGEYSVSGTTITHKKIDGTTTAMTFTVDSATAPTSRTRTT